MIVGNLWGATELFGKAGATTNVDENASGNGTLGKRHSRPSSLHWPLLMM